MKEIKFEIENTYVHCVKFGRGNNVLCIISGVSLCGFEGLGAVIEKQYECLSDDFTVYCFDRRKDIKKGFSIRDMADDIAIILKREAVTRADFFGVSQGGMAVLETAINYPTLVNKLMLCSTAAYASPVWDTCAASWKSHLLENDIYGFNMDFYKRVYSDSFYTENAEAIKVSAKIGTSKQACRFEILCDSISEFDIRARLQDIKCPCIVWGAENDNVFGAAASVELAKGISCGCEIIKGASHAMYDEIPEFAQRIKNFLLIA